jgi:hypothetical protein
MHKQGLGHTGGKLQWVLFVTLFCSLLSFSGYAPLAHFQQTKAVRTELLFSLGRKATKRSIWFKRAVFCVGTTNTPTFVTNRYVVQVLSAYHQWILVKFRHLLNVFYLLNPAIHFLHTKIPPQTSIEDAAFSVVR